ncbi:DUF1194 domain-containing protein, partial [Mesorhizobium sp. M1C.F.Ca.ET.204.01.1.1]
VLSPGEPVGPAEGVRAYLYPTGTELVGSTQQFAVQPYSGGVLNYRTASAGSDIGDSAQSANSFADKLAARPFRSFRGTSISSALAFGAELFN